jgi:hypothetical protein
MGTGREARLDRLSVSSSEEDTRQYFWNIDRVRRQHNNDSSRHPGLEHHESP